MTKEGLVLKMAAIVTVVWAASFVAGFVRNDYTPMGVTTPVMLAAMTYAIRNGKNGNGGSK